MNAKSEGEVRERVVILRINYVFQSALRGLRALKCALKLSPKRQN